MPAVTRIGDMSTGHPVGTCFFPPKPATQGSSNVFINGKACMALGYEWEVHCCGPSCHGSVSSSGSGNVFVNGRAITRIGDDISCNDVVAEGSSNVFAN
jgi:uncharacterized Zn-binding protein involved in type VI secretion